jgi:CRP/FNR family cyclic AMP-dependent transcriptional regulator
MLLWFCRLILCARWSADCLNFDNRYMRSSKPTGRSSTTVSWSMEMAANPWFAALPARERETLLTQSGRFRLRPGQMLFRQGDAVVKGQGAFFGLARGHVRISSLHEGGKEAILANLEPGNWFGEISLIDGQPRTHDATATGEAEVLMLPRAVFDTLMQRVVFARAISQLLATRTRWLCSVLEDAALRSTRARVARRLLSLSHGDATRLAAAKRVVPVSQEALAMMLGITRQTLNKELQGLVESGILALRYRQIEIIEPEKLKELGLE